MDQSPYGIPGISAAYESTERAPLWQTKGFGDLAYAANAVISSAAADAGNTPTYALRPGLVMGVIASSGEWAQYDADATDGTQNAAGILLEEVNLYDNLAGANVDRFTSKIAVAGRARAGDCINLDQQARNALSLRFQFDDDYPGPVGVPFGKVITKAADYTVVAADNGALFITAGASGAVTFTLPTIAAGLRFQFYNVVDQNMAVASAGSSDNIVGMNDLGADSITFSTSSQKIGACLEVQAVYVGADLKWLAKNLSAGANTATVA